MWYRVHASFGPGHQGKDTFYRWSDSHLSEDDESELADEMFQKWHWTEQIKVDVDGVEGIPEGIRDQMARMYESEIRSAQFMLEILRDPARAPIILK